MKKVTVTLGIGSYTTQTWRAWHVDGMFRVHGIFEGGVTMEASKQGYYNSLDEDIKEGWSRGNRGCRCLDSRSDGL